MTQPARLDIGAWRHEARVFTLYVRGEDLTGKSMVLEVRLAPDTPGAPVLQLVRQDDALALGLHLDQVTVENGVTVSKVSARITKAAMEALPYSGEMGSNSVFALGLQLNGVTRAYGTLTALATVVGADNALADRPPSAGGSSSGPGGLWESAALTIGPDAVTFTYAGLNYVAPLAAKAEAAAVAAEASRVGAGEVSRRFGLVPSGAQGGPGANDIALVYPADYPGPPVDGDVFRITPQITATGAVRIGIPQIGYLNLVTPDGGQVSSNIVAGWPILIQYASNNTMRLIQNSYDQVRLGRLVEKAAAPTLDAPLNSLRHAPWGTVANDQIAVTQCFIVGAGSSDYTDSSASVGREGGAPPGYAPVDRLCATITAKWPLGRIQWISDNKSHGGHVVGQFLGQLQESNVWVNAIAKYAHIGPGMNDFQVSQFDANQSFIPGFEGNLIAVIEANKGKGIKTILCTQMHLNTAKVDYAAFFRDNPGVGAKYPRILSAPVNTETGQYPPASKSAGGYGGVPKFDMTGSGILSEYDLRFMAGNAFIRHIGRQYPEDVILFDYEQAGFRYGVEVSGMASLYASSEIYHRNILGHTTAEDRIHDEFARDLIFGSVKRAYRGF